MSRTLSFPAAASIAYLAVAAQAVRPILPENGPTFCPFRAFIGLPCPGCGMGHSLVYAMRGDFAGSFSSHPLGIPLLILWTAWLAWGLVNVSRGRAFSEGFIPVLRGPVAGWAMLVLVLAVYAVRLV